MTKTTLNLSPPLTLLRDEAASMGLSLSALLTADMVRYRRLAAAALPTLSPWEWDLLSHVMSGIEAHRVLTGTDDLPSAGSIIAEIDTWANDATNDEALAAGDLRKWAATWSPLTIAGVLLQLRSDAVRQAERAK